MFHRKLNWPQVVGIDQGPEHVMTVWNWETEEESGKLLGKVATHQESFNIFYDHPLTWQFETVIEGISFWSRKFFVKRFKV